MTKPIGVDFKVQIVSVDKLTEITTRKVKGKMAPDFDTFIWGWGGDPYDPGLLLNLLTTKAIGGSSDAFYSNPEYDKLYDQQTGEFDQAARKAVVAQMIALSQRDLPYIVLTVDPALQAYRTDKLAGVERVVPAARRRHHLRPGGLRHVRGDEAGVGQRRRRRQQRRRLERADDRADRGRARRS